MGILLKLGYFIADNDDRNDTYIRAILKKHRLDIKDPDSRKVRCLGHIINLAAKAFLFGKTQTPLKTPQILLVKMVISKLHNTIKFVRCTPQRRQAFQRLMKDELGILLVSYL
jgi:hypothetical protein